MTESSLIEPLRRGSSPRTTRAVQKWSLWTKIRSWWIFLIFQMTLTDIFGVCRWLNPSDFRLEPTFRTQTHVLRPKRTHWSCRLDIWAVWIKFWAFRPSDWVGYNHVQTRVSCRVSFSKNLHNVINCVTVTRTIWIRRVYRSNSPGKWVSTSRNSENRVRQHNFEAAEKILAASKILSFLA